MDAVYGSPSGFHRKDEAEERQSTERPAGALALGKVIGPENSGHFGTRKKAILFVNKVLGWFDQVFSRPV
jgi:hypothetical protein